MRPHQSRPALLAMAWRALAGAALVAAAVGCGSSSDSDSFTALPEVELTDVGGAAVSSGDLVGWSDVPDFTMVSTTNNGDGTATVRYRSNSPFDPDDVRAFFRLMVSN